MRQPLLVHGIQEQMADPAISGDHLKFQEVAQEAARFQQAAEGYATYKDLEQQLAEAEAMLKESAGAVLAPQLCFSEMAGCSARGMRLLAHREPFMHNLALNDRGALKMCPLKLA